jgi:hypothetical protein
MNVRFAVGLPTGSLRWTLGWGTIDDFRRVRHVWFRGVLDSHVSAGCNTPAPITC